MNKEKQELQITSDQDIYLFDEITNFVNNAKNNTYRKVNQDLIKTYYWVGKRISEISKTSKNSSNLIDRLANHFKEHHPDLKGFNRRGLYRMKQFYEVYKDEDRVIPLLPQLSWSNHLKIISGSKSKEEREFYINLALRERLTHRELVRQMDSCYFEKYILSNVSTLPAINQAKLATKNIFLDNYVLEFFDPPILSEKDFQKSILANLKKFILEIGKQFIFIDSEYRVQVGNHDYYIDLLFFHRELACLVAFELKIGEFQPEYISKMNLYLEALDREVKNENENPSVGIILCTSKDDDVVEFTLNRSLSPTMVATYTQKLIDKNLLQNKLKEYVELAKNTEEND